MTYDPEKEITRLNALLAVYDDEIMYLREKLLEDRADDGRHLAQAWSENARLHRENEQLRRRIADLESARRPEITARGKRQHKQGE